MVDNSFRKAKDIPLNIPEHNRPSGVSGGDEKEDAHIKSMESSPSESGQAHGASPTLPYQGEQGEQPQEKVPYEKKQETIEPELSAPSLSPQEEEEGKKAPFTSELRWLTSWWSRQLKKLSPLKANTKEKRSLDLVFLEVLVTRDNEVKPDAAEKLFSSLASLHRGGALHFLKGQVGLSLEIVADHNHIHFIFAVPSDLKNFVEKQIHAAYPSAQIVVVPEYDIFKKEGYVSFAQILTTGPKYYSLQTYPELKEKEIDPLNGITSALTNLEEGEAAVIQIAISPADRGWQSQGHRLLIKAKEWERKPDSKHRVILSREVEEGIARKITKQGFYAVIRVVTASPSKQSADSHLQNIVGALNQLSQPHLASFRRKRIWSKKSFMVDFLYRHVPRVLHWTVLSTEELATLFHLPNRNITTPNINWLGAKTGAAPLNLPASGLHLGTTTHRGLTKDVFIQEDDRRRHVYILGQTGTGKSELAKYMAYQDILEGSGTCFIDPHGDTVEDLLAMIPQERVEDVIYFDPGDIQRPPGLNILEAETEEGKHLVVNSFIALLYKLYDPNRTGIMGPRLERAIRNVMLTAMSEPGNSLIEVMRLLTDPQFAASKVPLVQDPLVRRYWTDELAQTSDFHKSEVLGYFVSKFDRFVTEKLMRNIIGQSRSSFNFREVMDEQKILLVNLSKGRIGEENSNFLGLILVPRLLAAAMGRVDTPERERRDFYLYVDEFQNFTTPDFVRILSEARKYRLNLTVANQFIGQLSEEIKDAVFGNVGTLVSFRVGTDDAEYIEKQFDPFFSKSDLLNAPVGQAYTKLLINSAPSIPFSMKTDWEKMKAVPRDAQRAAKIRELSRERYARDQREVEEEIRLRAAL